MEKINSVVLVGDIATRPAFDDEQNESQPFSPGDSKMNMRDMPAARFFYQQCQLLGVPLVVVEEAVSQSMPLLARASL